MHHMINQGMRNDFNILCEHLGEGAGGEVGLFSVDSSDPPIFSGPLLGEQCPDGGKHDIFQSWVSSSLFTAT